MQGGQFDTADNLTPRTIWHHHKFYISTIVLPQNMIKSEILANYYLLGVKLSLSTCWCQIVLLCMMVSNCPRCQIVLGVKLSYNPLKHTFPFSGQWFLVRDVFVFCTNVFEGLNAKFQYPPKTVDLPTLQIDVLVHVWDVLWILHSFIAFLNPMSTIPQPLTD